MISKEYTTALKERAGYVGYNFCLVFLKPNERQEEIGENFKEFLHANNGHVPEDKVFKAGNVYLALVEGSSDSFRLTRGLRRNDEVRNVDDLISRFLLSELFSGKPLDVSIGIAEYRGKPDVLYQLAAYSQTRWTGEGKGLVSMNPMPERPEEIHIEDILLKVG